MMQIRIVCSATAHLEARPGLAVVAFAECDELLRACAFVLSVEDASTARVIDCVEKWRIPLFVIQNEGQDLCSPALAKLQPTLLQAPLSELAATRIIDVAREFESTTLPAFSSAIAQFVSRKRPTFACPGHQGGQCLDMHPAGLRFKQLLGAEVFSVDVPHAAPELGDVLSHEGPIKQAEDLAAKVFNADKTYFVLNGTSTANKIVTSALLTAGDLVLMDRNNHKSVYLGALVQSGARAVYLDNFRDDCGVLGGYRKGALQEEQLRAQGATIDEARARQPRPFRLAIVQHATCDGIVVDAGALLDRIGHLCDYVLFDCAWLGYEPFVDLLAPRSPLHIPLLPDAPGIIVTQSVHKQMSGLSQTSQIHKKDRHIQSQQRYCSDRVFNSAFMLHSSTSPFYPLFMSLEVNAAIHADGNGRRLWNAAVSVANEFRQQVDQHCRVIKPYYGNRMPSDDLAAQVYTQDFCPISRDANPIECGLHYLDPCKVMFTTRANKEAVACGQVSIPASIVACYLREMNFTPEKTDFYNFTLLVSPSSDAAQLTRLMRALEQLERALADGEWVSDILPSLASAGRGYANISLRELCCVINNLFQHYQIQQLQSDIFSSVAAAQAKLTPYAANQAFVRGQSRLIDIADAVGCVAAEGVIPYPPGVMCIAPGECWNGTLVGYLAAVQALANIYPELAPHIQGVHHEQHDDGTVALQVHVLDCVTV
ncbi:Ornithine decarboxylase, constitutive [compost metagenome]